MSKKLTRRGFVAASLACVLALAGCGSANSQAANQAATTAADPTEVHVA